MPFIVSCRKEYFFPPPLRERRRQGYIPGRCLLLDSKVMLTPTTQMFGNAHKPLCFSSLTSLSQADLHRLCLSSLGILHSFWRLQQQTLAAHSPLVLYLLPSAHDRGHLYMTDFTFERQGFQCLQVWSHLCLSGGYYILWNTLLTDFSLLTDFTVVRYTWFEPKVLERISPMP